MTPWQLAQQWYEQYMPNTDLAAAVAENFQRENAHIYVCRNLFAMAH